MDILKEFIHSLESSSSIATTTINAYKKDLDGFSKFLNEFVDKRSYPLVTEEDILLYLEYLKGDYSQNSIYRKLVSIRGFYKYLYKKGVVDSIPTKEIKLQRPKSLPPETLTLDEVEKILELCEDNFKGSLDRLFIKFLITSGLRIVDILQITLDDFTDSSFTKIKWSKGGSLLLVNLEEGLSLLIRNHLLKYKDSYNNKNLLFQGVTRQNFRLRLINYGRDSGISKTISPNIFRNTLGRELLDEGSDILKEKFNYSTLRDTTIYQTRNTKNIKELYMKIGIGDD